MSGEVCPASVFTLPVISQSVYSGNSRQMASSCAALSFVLSLAMCFHAWASIPVRVSSSAKGRLAGIRLLIIAINR